MEEDILEDTSDLLVNLSLDCSPPNDVIHGRAPTNTITISRTYMMTSTLVYDVISPLFTWATSNGGFLKAFNRSIQFRSTLFLQYST